MARGTLRNKRIQVLEELREHDPEWAAQLDALLPENPQAYRKQLVRADVALSARLGRPTILSMRPRRFGGQEDPELVRRVQTLRQHTFAREAHIQLPPPQWLDNVPEGEEGDDEVTADGEGFAAGSRFSPRGKARLDDGPQAPGDASPAIDQSDVGNTHGDWIHERTPPYPRPDLGTDDLPEGSARLRSRTGENHGDFPAAEGHRLRGRTGEHGVGDLPPAEGNRLRRRTEDSAFGDMPPADGHRLRGRSPEDRPAFEVDASPDLSVLAGTVSDVKQALASGSFDRHLDAVARAEREGKGRKSVLAAIDARRG